MIRKQQRVVFTFHTTTDAMATESLCKEKNLGGRMIPVPGEITADCGLAWCAAPEKGAIVTDAQFAAGIPVQGVYRLMI